MYFRTKKSQRVSQNEPETPPKSPIIIEESPREEERFRETVLKEKLQMAQENNIALREKFQQKGHQVATMVDLCIEELQHKFPYDLYIVYLKEKWLLFQVKTLASHGSLPFQDCRKFMDFYKQANMDDQERNGKVLCA